MLLTTETYVTWNARNKAHYVNLGYIFTKMNDSFLVKVEHLTKGSNVIVEVMCDYCGEISKVPWYSYINLKKKEKIHKDACRKCCELKSKEAIDSIYGGYTGLYNSTNDKRKKTNVERYGSENVFASEEIKKRIVNTNMERYGCEHSQSNKLVRAKTMATCKQRYGVDNYVELFKGKFIKENSPVWKGGVEQSRFERSTHEYIEWRSEVFGRDLYTCKCCGDKNGNGHEVILHAHHLYNWRDNEELRYDVNNGVTLCDSCHYKFHSIYGKKNNNPEQFYNFSEKYINNFR